MRLIPFARLEVEGILFDTDPTPRPRKSGMFSGEAASPNCKLFSLQEFVEKVFSTAADKREATRCKLVFHPRELTGHQEPRKP